MDQIKRILENLKGSTSPIYSPIKYECEKCKDTGLIEYYKDIEMYEKPVAYYKDCECALVKRYIELQEKSGLKNIIDSMTFDNYSIVKKPKIIISAKEVATKYALGFDGNKSFAMLGQVGCGKTHLCTAICGELMKKYVPVLYMQYRTTITELKRVLQGKDTEEDYTKAIGRYKNAPVLYIDDLYKGADKQGSLNESDLRIMFEIINHRYSNNKQIIISSEYSASKLLQFDEAVGSRIIEMAKGFIVEFPQAIELNHRLVG